MSDREIKFRHDLGNDKWVIERIFPGKKNGFFIEAGATNGINGSATYILEKDFDWKGICVEPIPPQYEQIRRFRSASADNRALWHKTGLTLEFTMFPNRTGHSGLTETNKNVGRRDFQEESKTILEVQTVTLLELLRQHDAPQVIDYLCLDVEGAERSVLENHDFSGPYTLLAVSIEGHNCDDIMRAAGYRQMRNPFTEQTFESYWVHPSVAVQSEDLIDLSKKM